MSLTDGIVREFRSGIISSFVPPTVARNGNKRSNGVYVRHEDPDADRNPSIAVTCRSYRPDGDMNFYARRKNRFPSVPAIGISISARFSPPKRSRVSECIFMALPNQKISKSDRSVFSVTRIACTRYMKLAIGLIDDFYDGESVKVVAS